MLLPRFSTERVRRAPQQVETPERDRDDRSAAFVLVTSRKNRREVVAASREALAAGIAPGMTATEAAAIVPDVRVLDHDVPSDARELNRLLAWAVRFSPQVGALAPAMLMEAQGGGLPANRPASGQQALRSQTAGKMPAPLAVPVGGSALDLGCGPVGLWLDVTGNERLFGSERRLLARIVRELVAEGYRSVRGAIADTVLGARALALAGPRRFFVAPAGRERLVEALAPLPIGVLPMAEETLAQLAALALDTVGALRTVDRAGLVARLGEPLLRALDAACGVARDDRDAKPHKETPAVSLALPGPTDQQDALLFLLKRLCDALCDELARQALGARSLHLTLRRQDRQASPLRVDVTLTVAQRQAKPLFALLRERVERIDLSIPVDGLELSAPECAPLGNTQRKLFAKDGAAQGGGSPTRRPAPQGGGSPTRRPASGVSAAQSQKAGQRPAPLDGSERDEARDLARLGPLLDRLRDRLGETAVGVVDLVEAHLPEQSQAFVPLASRRLLRRAPSETIAAPPQLARPTILLREPTPVTITRNDDTFDLGGHPYHITHRVGPERIETAWWQQPKSPSPRDYLMVQTKEGPTFWLYRPRPTTDDTAWWVHGIFD